MELHTAKRDVELSKQTPTKLSKKEKKKQKESKKLFKQKKMDADKVNFLENILMHHNVVVLRCLDTKYLKHAGEKLNLFGLYAIKRFCITVSDDLYFIEH